MHKTIGIVFDFDDTLAPDSTSAYLRHMGVQDLHRFWQDEVAKMMEQEDWNPVPAYMFNMHRYSQTGLCQTMTQESMATFGKTLPLHPGVSSIFSRLRQVAQEANPYINLEFYLISSGIGEIVRNTAIAHEFKDIWASEFYFNEAGAIAFPKKVVSFTDKTRYLFQIQKGLVGERAFGKPFDVNLKCPKEKHHIPFKQMIFVGDGYTDIPCFSLIKKQGGVAIAVYDPQRRDKWESAYQFMYQGRVNNLLSVNYAPDGELSLFLSLAVRKMALDVSINGLYA